MGKTLVIVESPTKAKTISKFLGKDYKIESSFGHIRDLPKSKMGVETEDESFEPTYRVPKDKQQKVKELKKLADAADGIIFATDEDREGEAISWHLAELFKLKPENTKRIVFHEITKHAIERALEDPRHIDMNLVDAQQARRILDRLVGYELSPLLWKKVARGLSAGRVQSVAVRLIVEREREREAFTSQEYWSLQAALGTDKNDPEQGSFIAALHKINEKKLEKLAISTKEQMDVILKDLEGARYAISHIEKKETKKTPPPPFRTSTLQQQANQVYGFSSKQTMMLAQQLYEGVELGSEGHVGLITYMRTDSTQMSEKFLQEARAHILNEYGNNYTVEKPRVYKSKAKGAQEAHEAIRPADPARTPESVRPFLNPRQFKLYQLIWKRSLATQMSAARLNKTTIDITVKQYEFRATGQTMIFDGWLKLYPNKTKEELLPELTAATPVYCHALEPKQHFTQPPARYSDATLVKILEAHGIGRPSTYAPTIATIEARRYVERDEDKRLKPLEIARVVNDLLVEHFPEIVDYGFTAQMEEDLDAVAEGKKGWRPIIKEFYRPFHQTIVKKTETLDKQEVIGTRELGIDPESGKEVSARVGRYGPYVQKGTKDDEEKPTFASIPKDKNLETITLEEALHLLSLPKELGTDSEENTVTVGIGRFGPYVKINSAYYSVKDHDPYTIDLKAALEIVEEKKQAKANSILQDFPDEGIQVLEGRYGPYITNGTKNARVPKDTDPKKLDLETCKELLEKAPAKKSGRRARGKKKKTAKTSSTPASE